MPDNNKNFVGGLVLGGLLGVVLGLMIAPESGEKTRQKLKNKFGDLQDFLTDEIGIISKKVKKSGVVKKAKDLIKKKK